MTGKERNSNQPRNWEIMHTIVVQGRRGPQPAQLFPNTHACCCFCHFEEDRENEKCLHGQFTQNQFILQATSSRATRLNTCIQLLTYNFALHKHS